MQHKSRCFAGCGLLLALLMTYGAQAQPFKVHTSLVPTPDSTGSFRVVEGQLVWTMSGPDASMAHFAREFWRGQRRNLVLWPDLAHTLNSLTWILDIDKGIDLRFTDIDVSQQTMRCSTNVPLGASARAMFEALGCVWDMS